LFDSLGEANAVAAGTACLLRNDLLATGGFQLCDLAGEILIAANLGTAN
jgi:hypothetical protein